MKTFTRNNKLPSGNWTKQSFEFSIPESIRTFFADGNKFRIWTPETIFRFELHADKEKVLISGGGYCCRIYFDYNNIKFPISSSFLYLKDRGKVCFDHELHYHDFLFKNHKELKDWAVNMHFNSKHKICLLLKNLHELTTEKKHQEIFKLITERP